MGNPCPLITRKINILGRIETNPGTAETLDANDGKIRIITGAEPEYDAPRTPRDIARATLTNLGSVESTKQLNQSFQCEANTRDTIENLANLDVDTIEFQSALAGGVGSIVRYTFNGSPDLSGIVAGMYLDSNYATNASNVGTFKITTVNDGSDYVEVVNRVRTDDTDDEASDSPCVGDIQNPLEFQWAMNACSMQVRGISRIAMGSITGSGYVRNEVITGGNSSATGRVIVPAEDGDSHIYFEPVSGKLESGETLTGATSSSTATSSSAPGVHGHFVRPVSGDNCDQEAATVNFQNDGYRWQSRTAMGNFQMEAEANGRLMQSFSFNGAKSVIGDQALTSVTRDNEDPPIVKQAEMKLDTFEPVFSNFALDMGNEVVMRQNGNAPDDSGFEGARITARIPKITINLEHDLAANFDFFDKLDQGTKTAFQMHAGNTTDKTVWVFADELEFEALPLEDQDGIRGIALEAMLTGDAADADDELEIVFI